MDYGFLIKDYGLLIMDCGFLIMDYNFLIMDYGLLIIDYRFIAKNKFEVSIENPKFRHPLLNSHWLRHGKWKGHDNDS